MSRVATTWIDVSELDNWSGRLTGVPRVMSELTSRFSGDKSYVFVTWDGIEHCYRPANLSKGQGSKTAARARRVLALPGKLVRKTQASSGSQVSPQPGDLLFVLADWHGSDQAFVDYLLTMKNSGVSLVQMVYDLLPLVTPQYSGHATTSLTNYAKQVYPVCERMLAISEHTRRDTQDWLKSHKLNVPPIDVIRLGDDFQPAPAVKPSTTPPLSDKGFILCVGTIEARKNHTLLYYAYRRAQAKGVELPPLVIVGRRGWKSEDVYEFITTDPAVKSKFILQENASDGELSWLYEHCLFSIYPSFYEGWGLPIAESLLRGTPCVASNTSSMPEVAGDLVEYFNPFSTDECLEAISRLIQPEANAAARRKLKAYVPTTWDQTFAMVKKIIETTHGR